MIELKQNQLVFRFPEVHKDAVCSIQFQRTLRIPDDNREYPLPPGLDSFPLQHVDDFADRVPDTWKQHGGVFLPMYQAEAMWINFNGHYPMAIKVAAGKIDAMTGEQWSNQLGTNPQNYLVVPDQPWLDGFSVGQGLIRQFVAMPLGAGFTAEEQLSGEAQHGGLQIVAYPIKASVYEELLKEEEELAVHASMAPVMSAPAEMGLAPGGLMRQEIYEDNFDFDNWELKVRSRCFVHVLNSVQYFEVSGEEPPTEPPTAWEYTEAGLPWFEYYGEDRKALAGAASLAGLDSVAAMQVKQGKGVLKDNEPVQPDKIVPLNSGSVREGEF